MITVSDDRAARRLNFVWAALASCALNLLVWIFVLWLAQLSVRLKQIDEHQPELIVSSTSSVQIEHRRTVPRPQTAPASAAALPRSPRVQRPHPQMTPPGQRREIARERPNAPAQPPPSARPTASRQPSFSQVLAMQQQSFERESKRLRAENNPLSVATLAPASPSSMRKSYTDISGHLQREGVEALLVPLKHWYDGDMSCYYVRYQAEFTGGGSEEGTIPWPVCYPRSADRMLPLDRTHDLPIPVPPPGYVLPAGTYLTPLLRAIYEKHVNA